MARNKLNLLTYLLTNNTNTGFYHARQMQSIVAGFRRAIIESKNHNFTGDQELFISVLIPGIIRMEIKLLYLSTRLFPSSQSFLEDGDMKL